MSDALTNALPALNYGELFAHTLITMALFYGGIALWLRIRDALRRETLAVRIAALRDKDAP